MKYTIIITVYNKEKYIERALNSAFNQTFNNYKVIVVNDGSTDNSDNLIKKYHKKYKFKYYKKENTGVSDTRNFAIEKVDTDYFLFLDADDYISLDLLEQIDKYNSYDVLSFNAIKLDENENYIKTMSKPRYKGNGEEYFEKLVKERVEFISPWGYVYNKNFFRKNNFLYPKGKILEDYYLTPFIIIESKKIIAIDYIGYCYVTINNSIINGNKKLIEETFLSHFDEMMKLIQKYNENTQKVFKSFLAETMIWYGNTLHGKQQKRFINISRKKKFIKLLDKPYYRKIIINILYNTYLYYPLRKLIKVKCRKNVREL